MLNSLTSLRSSRKESATADLAGKWRKLERKSQSYTHSWRRRGRKARSSQLEQSLYISSDRLSGEHCTVLHGKRKYEVKPGETQTAVRSNHLHIFPTHISRLTPATSFYLCSLINTSRATEISCTTTTVLVLPFFLFLLIPTHVNVNKTHPTRRGTSFKLSATS